ncbi:MAG TPA: hypothetical protein DEP84_34865 [Chloroflexi bacterium]|nr:hypothetical protein [Chloroflexota bacterium]
MSRPAWLSQAGYRYIDIEIRQLDLEMLALEDFVPQHVSATPMAGGFNVASHTTQQEMIREVSNRRTRYATESGLRIPFKMVLTMAVKGRER